MSRREKHPLEPFFPKDAEILILGSFPPPKARWSMEFFYPNRQNDFWRILGLVFFNDRDHFLLPEADSRDEKGVRYFDEGKIRRFLTERRIALYDAAIEVIREKGNASDSALTVVRALDLATALKNLPCVRAILLTGQKSMEGGSGKPLLTARLRIFFVWQENRMRPIFIGRNEIFAV